MPSLVGFDEHGQVVVGEAAESSIPGQTVRSIKRAITKRRSLIRGPAPYGVRDVSADEFIVAVLRSVGRRADAVGLDLAVQGGVRVGCPAVWDGGQRRRYLDLLHRAGIAARPSDLVDEPVAAGIGWLESQARADAPMRALVFDMGGGTLDIAVMDVCGSGDRDVHLLAAVGQSRAGDALDEAIADDLAQDLRVGPDPSEHQRELLLDAARRLKIRLSTDDEHVVVLQRDLFPELNEAWYSRERLESALSAQLPEATQCLMVALRVAHLATGGNRNDWPSPERLLAGIDLVLLSGGMSRVPGVAEHLRALLPESTRIELAADPPEKAVVLGLTRAHHYQRTVRYALPYDIWLEWDEGHGSRLLYQAYMPILEQWWIEREWMGEFRFRAMGDGLPDHGRGVLRAVADMDVAATLNGASLDGYPVALNGDRFSFTIDPDGRLEMVDADGVHTGRAYG
jgi:molecular chaperone DnaK (HSP70)